MFSIASLLPLRDDFGDDFDASRHGRASLSEDNVARSRFSCLALPVVSRTMVELSPRHFDLS